MHATGLFIEPWIPTKYCQKNLVRVMKVSMDIRMDAKLIAMSQEPFGQWIKKKTQETIMQPGKPI